MLAAGPLFADQLRAHARLLEAQLAHGRSFLLGVARASTPATPITPDARGPTGLAPGMRVRVVPDDYGFDPVEGEIVALKIHTIAIRRVAPEVGEVVVHFPRAGFRVTRV